MPFFDPHVQKMPSVTKPSVTAQQLQEKLKAIPAFIITDPAGVPLTVTVNKKQLIWTFMRHRDAEAHLANLKKQQENLANMRVVVVPLSAIHDIVAKATIPMIIGYVPDEKEVDEAVKIRKAQGNDKPLDAVPLFMAKVQGKGFVSLRKGAVELIPACFSYNEIRKIMEDYNGKRPPGTPEAKVELATLEEVLLNMRTSSNLLYTKVNFIPAQISLVEAEQLARSPKAKG